MIKVKLNNVDITGYLYYEQNIEFTLLRGQRGTCTLPFIIRSWYLENAIDNAAIGQTIFIYEIDSDTMEETCCWCGTVDTLEQDWLGNAGDYTLTITGVDFSQLFDTQVLNLTFSNMTAGSIVTALFEATGVTAVALGTVQDGPIVDSLIVTRVSDALNTLQNEAGFIWYIDPATQTLNFVAPGTFAASWVVISQDMLFQSIDWKQTRQDYRNVQTTLSSTGTVATPAAGAGATDFVPIISPTLASQFTALGIDFLELATQPYMYGVFTAQPTAGDTITLASVAGATFTFVASGAGGTNVLIGATLDDTVANLVTAINGTSLGLQAEKSDVTPGVALEVWAPSPTTATSGYIAAAGCSVFQWGAATLGGTGCFPAAPGPGAETAPTGYQLVANPPVDYTSSTLPQPVSLVVVPPLPVGVVGYYTNFPFWVGQSTDIAFSGLQALAQPVSATATPTAGSVTQLTTLTSAATLAGIQQEVNAVLTRYSDVPQQVTFVTDFPGLSVGTALTFELTSPPGSGPGNVDNINVQTWFIQEVDATLIAGMDKNPEPYGHFRYTITVINKLDIGNFVQFWAQLANVGATPNTSTQPSTGNGSGASSGPASGQVFSRTLTITDTTVADNVAAAVPVQCPGTGWRVLAMLSQSISDDLVVDLYKSGVLLVEITIPTSLALNTSQETILTTGSPAVGPTFADQEPLTVNITASDGSMAATGIATLTLQWVGT